MAQRLETNPDVPRHNVCPKSLIGTEISPGLIIPRNGGVPRALLVLVGSGIHSIKKPRHVREHGEFAGSRNAGLEVWKLKNRIYGSVPELLLWGLAYSASG